MLGQRRSEPGQAVAADRVGGGAREVGGDDRQAAVERDLGDRLVETPFRPARTRPVHRVAEPGRVLRAPRQEARERRGVVGREHLEADDRAPAHLDQPPHHARLEHVVVGVVVTLAQHHPAARGEQSSGSGTRRRRRAPAVPSRAPRG